MSTGVNCKSANIRLSEEQHLHTDVAGGIAASGDRRSINSFDPTERLFACIVGGPFRLAIDVNTTRLSKFGNNPALQSTVPI
eukprot:scaffold343122_cov20-Prasinocladus_malaysianus.AAC.1